MTKTLITHYEESRILGTMSLSSKLEVLHEINLDRVLTGTMVEIKALSKARLTSNSKLTLIASLKISRIQDLLKAVK